MKQIYAITETFAKYENNKVTEVLGTEILYAVSNEKEAKEIIERYYKNGYKEKAEWFKNHQYGTFAIEYNYKKIELY